MIDYDESGDGPTIVFVPGSCSTAAAWRPIISLLDRRFRCVTTSLLGYGGTEERRTGVRTDIGCEAEIVETVVRQAGCPVHLVGHSFGGLTALSVALRREVPLSSLTMIDTPLPQLLQRMGEHQHHRAFRVMMDGYFRAFHAGDKSAIASMIDFYAGEGTFAAWPQRVRDYAIETTPVNILDWATAFSFHPTPDSLANIEVPTLILYGGRSHPAVQRGNELLGECMKNASVRTIRNASHFLISTHPKEVARAIGLQVEDVEHISPAHLMSMALMMF